MGDRAIEGLDLAGPDASTRLGFERDPLASEAATGVVSERPRQQPGTYEGLKPVANPDDWLAGVDESPQTIGSHVPQREGEHSACAECVGVAETTSDNEYLCVSKHCRCRRDLFEPHDPWSRSRHLEGKRDVVITIGARCAEN